MSSYYYDSTVLSLVSSLITFVFSVGAYVLYSIFYMKLFEKAGVQGKWRAWVPVYREMIFLKLGDLSPWLFLYFVGALFLGIIIPFLGWFLLLPLAGLAYRVVTALAAYRIGQKLQKEGAWVVLYIFLDIVWLGIMAFDKSRWNVNIRTAGWGNNAFLGDRTVWDGIPVQPSAAPAPGAAPGYGAPQGYAPPQGYQQPGYQQPGYQPPAPGAPATPPAPPSAPVTPPPAPSTPPAAPSTPPTAPSTPPAPTTPPTTPPPAAPPAPPAPPAGPNQPPANPNQPPA